MKVFICPVTKQKKMKSGYETDLYCWCCSNLNKNIVESFYSIKPVVQMFLIIQFLVGQYVVNKSPNASMHQYLNLSWLDLLTWFYKHLWNYWLQSSDNTYRDIGHRRRRFDWFFKLFPIWKTIKIRVHLRN